MRTGAEQGAKSLGPGRYLKDLEFYSKTGTPLEGFEQWGMQSNI